MAGLNWTEEQQKSIDKVISDEIENSRLAHKLIPEYSLSPSDRTAAQDKYDYTNGTINEKHIELEFPKEEFFLSKLQTEDEDLSLAKMRVRRAAQQLAKKHDRYVFLDTIRKEINNNRSGKKPDGYHEVLDIKSPYNDNLVSVVANAIGKLDSEGYRTGYVMVAGKDVWTYLHTRATGAADLPVKAVKGLLDDGPVHRSAVLPDNEALILSISGGEIDRAVAEHPTLEFLRVGKNENREFRLYERFLTRFKQTYAAVLLQLV